ncbi:MAG: hypothetical protein ACFFG0_26475 [Candidatus Thorarchaeota archaeon]
MLKTECSEKLVRYLRKIEMLTGRQINIQEIPASDLYKMKSAFVHHPINIHIIIASGSKPTDPEIEQSIAHEATHGLIVYKMKYAVGFFKRPPNDKEKKLITLVFTMISDIIVNKLIQKEGFLPYSPRYPEMVTEELSSMEKGIDLYNYLINEPSYRDKHMIFRYILAWGYLKFIDLDNNMHKILINFINEFQLKNTKQFLMAMKIQEIILKNEIFSADGYKKAIKEILSLWELEDVVVLKTV